MRQILFLVPYPLNEAPSQRFRFEQYWRHLTDQGFSFAVQSFLPKRHWKIFYRRGNTLLKTYILISGFLKRLFILTKVPRFDFIFIHRELTPIGPPVFEWIGASAHRSCGAADTDARRCRGTRASFRAAARTRHCGRRP